MFLTSYLNNEHFQMRYKILDPKGLDYLTITVVDLIRFIF